MTADPLAADFRNFLFLIWQHLTIPKPTNTQYEIAGFMQHGYPDGYDSKKGRPVLVRVWPRGCTFEEAAWAKGRKEQLIIDTLESVMNKYLLVVDESVARDQTFVYQLTHITRERASLRYDDRVDSLRYLSDRSIFSPYRPSSPMMLYRDGRRWSISG